MHSRTHSPAVFRNMPLLSPSRPPLFLSPRFPPPPSPAYCPPPRSSRYRESHAMFGHHPSRVQSMTHIFREYLLSGYVCRASSNERRDPTAITANANREIGEYRVVDMCADRSARPCRELRTGPISIRGSPLAPPTLEFSVFSSSIGKRGRIAALYKRVKQPRARFLFVRRNRVCAIA